MTENQFLSICKNRFLSNCENRFLSDSCILCLGKVARGADGALLQSRCYIIQMETSANNLKSRIQIQIQHVN